MTKQRSSRKRRSHLKRNVIAAGLIIAVLVGGYFFSQKTKIDVDALLLRAQQQYETGDLQASAIDLKTVISEQPDNRAARFLLGRIYIQAGNPKGALKELGRARDLGATDRNIGLGITRALLLTGKFDEAATEIAISGDTSQPDWLVLRGMLDLAQQRLGDARAIFESILELHPGHEEARRGLMQAELAAGNADLARKEVELLLETAASDANLWIIKGELDLHDSNYSLARESFAHAVELEPANPIALIGIARSFVALGRIDEAANHLDMIGADGEQDPRVNFLRAQVAEVREEPNSALRSLRKVLQIAPMHRESLVMAAKLHFGRSEFTRAQDYVERLLAIEPGNVAAQRMRGAVQLAAGRLDGFDEIADAPGDPASIEDPGTLALLGTAYLKHGRFADSQASLERAAELAPDSLPIRTQLALSRLSAGEPAMAAAELKAIIAENADFVQADIMLALVYLSQGEMQDALGVATNLRTKHPQSALAHNVYGYVLEVSGDTSAASTAFQTALEMDSAFHPARVNLARLAITAGDREGGRQYFKGVLAQNAYHAFALMGLAALALQDDEFDEAERLWLLAREHNPDAVAPRYLLARHYRAKSNATLAQVLIKEAYKLAPYSPQIQGLYAEIMLEAGEYESALNAAQSLVARVPGSLQGLELVARIYNQLGDESGLTETLETIAEIAPEAAGARVLLGRLAVRRKDFDSAEKISRALIATEENAAIGHELEGDAYVAQEQLTAALAAYEQALAISPMTSTVLKLDQVERRLEQATDRLDQWLNAHPDDLQVRLVRASYMQQQGSGRTAIPEYERMMEQQTDNPIVLNNLAWLHRSDLITH